MSGYITTAIAALGTVALVWNLDDNKALAFGLVASTVITMGALIHNTRAGIERD